MSFLLRKYKNRTLFFLLGLVLGSLSIAINKIMMFKDTYIPADYLIMITVFCFGLGLSNLLNLKKKTHKLNFKN